MDLDQKRGRHYREAFDRARQRHEKAVAKIVREIDAEVDGTPEPKSKRKLEREVAKKVRYGRSAPKPNRNRKMQVERSFQLVRHEADGYITLQIGKKM